MVKVTVNRLPSARPLRRSNVPLPLAQIERDSWGKSISALPQPQQDMRVLTSLPPCLESVPAVTLLSTQSGESHDSSLSPSSSAQLQLPTNPSLQDSWMTQSLQEISQLVASQSSICDVRSVPLQLPTLQLSQAQPKLPLMSLNGNPFGVHHSGIMPPWKAHLVILALRFLVVCGLGLQLLQHFQQTSK
jgi:hypothetical protein